VERSLALAGGDLSVEALDRAVEIFRDRYAAHLLDTTRPYAGMVEAVSSIAAAGAKVSVLTNKPTALSRDILHRLGLQPFIFRVIGDDGRIPRKPDPAGVEELVRNSGVPRHLSVLVGDSLVDIETARAAKVEVCAVTWGFNTADDLRSAGPDHLIDEPDMLLGLEPLVRSTATG
jgi:phosphoglycolate phosphatase